MYRPGFLIAALPLLGVPAVAIAHAEGDSCADAKTTAMIVSCIQRKTKEWDDRLNAAYAELKQRIDPSQQEPLQAAQRLWIQYRDANCRFYGSQEGTIRQIEAAECLRSMTEDRATELEGAMRPL